MSPALPNLPITPSLTQISAALEQQHLVLGAPPGSGKTTLVPLALLDAPWLAGKKIIMLEPRRPAARMAAQRMASLLGENVGDQVGYQVRFERRIGKHTRIEVLTEGLLLRRLQQDPELADTAVVIFDEFHERSLTGDLSLALCLDAAEALRDDLRILLMSASMDIHALAAHINGQALQAEGSAYPVEIHHLDKDPLPEQRQLQLNNLVRKAVNDTQGDILVFLPGKGEIKRLQQSLGESLSPDIELLPLHGELSAKEQDSVINGHGKQRRIILSTDIAETSLTIEGISTVVDSGQNRKPHFDPNSGMTRLETAQISQASALQRAGRAGRLGPGSSYRAWSKAREQRMPKDIQAEIIEADLASLVLELANWGVTAAADLKWVTAPPEAHWAQASELLKQLGALNPQGQITSAGKQMVRLPTHPRLAHMLLQAGSRNRQLACDIAALLSERDPMQRRGSADSNSDLTIRLEAMNQYRQGGKPGGFNAQALSRLKQVATQFQKMLPDEHTNTPPLSPGECLALAFPDRIGKARKANSHQYLLSNGRAAALPQHDALSGTDCIVVGALDAGHRDGRIWLAAGIDELTLQNQFAEQLVSQREVLWDDQAQAVRAQKVVRLGALLLNQQVQALSAEDDPTPLLLNQVNKLGLSRFASYPALQQLQGKIALLRKHLPEQNWPDLSDQALLDSSEEWLPSWLGGVSSQKQLLKIDIANAVAQQLSWEQQQHLEQLLPSHFNTPAGTRRKIEYPDSGEPYLSVPLQEMLGEKQTPCIAQGRIPLTLHLLSPARRPLQITKDLATFWASSYSEVKKEMRGRYPKHHWPDDPASAEATRFTKKRALQGKS